MEPRRSIQDIIPPARSQPIRPQGFSSSHSFEKSPMPPPIPPQPIQLKPEGSGYMNLILAAAAILLVIGIGIGIVSTVFHRAYATVTPYEFSAPIQQSFSTTPNSTTLPYQKVEVTDTATKSVAANGTQHVENHASGTITIYNAFSTTQQRLITNTRFQTSDGLIFRIHEPAVIPGYTIKAGVKVPGSLDVTAYADEAGEKYNIGLSDFIVPGLKGSKQYSLITARSKTPMTAGFIGQQAVVDPTLRQQTVDGLKADLDRSLHAKILSAAAVGTRVFPDSVSISYTENNDSVQGQNALISVSGTASAPAFNENTLARALASVANISYTGDLFVKNPNSLSVHVDPPGAIGTGEPITVSISGTAILAASLDQTQLAKDLAGKSKKDIETVLPNYPGISNIDVKVYPFWLSGIPNDPSKVKISLVDPTPQTTQ